MRHLKRGRSNIGSAICFRCYSLLTCFDPKSKDSIGDVQVDAELMDFSAAIGAKATEEFVIESDR